MRFCVMTTLLVGLLSTFQASAFEGMWTLDNLPRLELQQHYQFDPDKQWIDNVSHAALRLLPGCSASFVSPNGLVLTNQHCIRRCLEALSSARNNLLINGFLAVTPSAELQCPGMELDQLEETIDVTEEIKGAIKDKIGGEFSKAYDQIATSLNDRCLHSHSDVAARCDVLALYHGGKYVLQRYHRYVDARVVWAPELAIAFFGGDLDNYDYPRYDLDAAFIRLYENGKPVVAPSFFRINRSGPVSGELLIEAGNPGATQRELTIAQLKTIRDVRLLRMVVLGSEYRGVLQQYASRSRNTARIVENELYSVENGLKSWRGQLNALSSEVLLDKKRDAETALRKFATLHAGYSGVDAAFQQIESAEGVYRTIGTEYYFLESEKAFLSRYFRFARILVRNAIERTKPNELRLPEFEDLMLPEMESTLLSTSPIYPEFEKVKLSWSLAKMREWLGVDNKTVRKVLDGGSPEKVASRLVAATRLGDVATRRLLWAKPELVMTSDDPFIKLAFAVDEDARAIRQRYELEVEGVEQRASQVLADARFAMKEDAYPDATFSLRLSFGELKGWQEGERFVEPSTFIKDAYQHHTGSEPFALPVSWVNARTRMSGQIPFNYITTHDSVGGNSGSAIINRDGELVGLVFDGNIHSLGGAFGFEENLNRAIAVHPAALLHALKVIYNADALLGELDPM